MSRVMICTNHMRNLAGSEVVTLELIEYFLDRGWYVDVYTNDLGTPVLDEIVSLPSWGRLRVVVASPEEEFPDDYDLIWIQHGLLPPTMIRRLESSGIIAPIVWHHLSSFMAIELPILASVETALATVSTVISPEVSERVMDFGLSQGRVRLFDNPAPDAFGNFATPVRKPEVERILIVSNHPPEEVSRAAQQLEAEGVRVDFLGEGKNPQRVTPELLAEYDGIITIGKTVQYGLSMGIPCYVYDHFGGIGWLSEENLESELHHNFSGRATGRRVAADVIARELRDGFEAASSFSHERRNEFAERWRLSGQMERLLGDPRLTEAGRTTISAPLAQQYNTFLSLHGDLYRLVVKLQLDLGEMDRKIITGTLLAESLQCERDALHSELQDSRAEVVELKREALRTAERQEHSELFRRASAILSSRRWRVATRIRRLIRPFASPMLTKDVAYEMSVPELTAALQAVEESISMQIGRRFLKPSS
ncbi:hypothetical protein AB4Y63_14695 [Leifsonia sp. YAF41]|uniref:hypothetical protein n=1 Tax=Leifsonia sp. YAF41 TaxID=3233086 RepID=UPI003F9CE45B